jgi:hypothetical protein
MPNVGVIDVVAIFRSECPRDVSAFVGVLVSAVSLISIPTLKKALAMGSGGQPPRFYGKAIRSDW